MQITRFEPETWTHVARMNVVQMDYGQAMTFNQRFLERREQQLGSKSDFAKRKEEHEALSRRIEARDKALGTRQRVQLAFMVNSAPVVPSPSLL